MLDEIQDDASERMTKTVETFQQDLKKIRTGRAHTSLLDAVTVPYYGMDVPLNQVANVGVADARTLTIQPYEKSMIQPIEKAIVNSNLGLTPNSAGQMIHIPLPPLTEERRKELTKVVREEAEQARVAVRNIRRDANSQLKSSMKNKDISEDDEKRGEDAIQKLTDKYIGQIDDLLADKEKELMEI